MKFNTAAITGDRTGLIQDCEHTIFGDTGYGRISGTPDLLLQFTARIHRAQDRFTKLVFEADGTWQIDDNNNTDFPIATTTINSGQRDYTFDSSMLEIEKVYILAGATATIYIPIEPVDISQRGTSAIGENNSINVGIPRRYDKTGNSIILDATPNYSAPLGLKIIFKRKMGYFASTDTTKEPGFASIFHSYLSQKASYDYAIDRQLPVATNTRYTKSGLALRVQEMETDITSFYSRRASDERPVVEQIITSFI